MAAVGKAGRRGIDSRVAVVQMLAVLSEGRAPEYRKPVASIVSAEPG